ncbi:MAG: sigma 54-interacting transcriptional regulator, partial [Acidobacteriota bacterium]
MSDPLGEIDGTQTQAPTQMDSTIWSQMSAEVRVHGLTVLYHPDLERVGERTLLEGLDAGRTSELSRQTPEFAQPGSTSAGRSLAEVRLSRTPILLRAAEGGGVQIERGESPTRLAVGGAEVDRQVTVSAAAVADGVVLMLASRVVLLLHRLDPVADTRTPRFDLVGESPEIAQIRRDIVQVADLRVPILLRGESGTGKELVARMIHQSSARRHQPFEPLVCASLPETLL